MTEKLPAPLVPAEVDLRGYEFMPLYGDRLFNSATWIAANYEARCAMLRLWWHSYAKEVPAGSLPDNETFLASYAGYGEAVKAWSKVKAAAMRGWKLCADGRWYHPVTAEIALESWAGRQEHRRRTTKARIAALEKRLIGLSNKDEREHVEGLIQGLRQTLSQTSAASVTGERGVSDKVSNTPPQGRVVTGKRGNGDASTRAGEGQTLLKHPPGPEADPEHIAREKRIAALLTEGKVDEAKKVKAGLA